MSLISKIKYYGQLLDFFIARRLMTLSIPSEPYFDEKAKEFFQSSLKNCRFYLEYGSGGSTVLAARLGKNFISADTDRFFQKCVGKKIGRLSPGQRFVHTDVGLTGPWGKPLRVKHISRHRLKKWRTHADRPWQFIDSASPPDLILIDGRFRVVSFLTCCAKLPAGAETKILVDDYVGRPHYRVMEECAQLVETRGQMAVFRLLPEKSPKLDALLEEYSRDWR